MDTKDKKNRLWMCGNVTIVSITGQYLCDVVHHRERAPLYSAVDSHFLTVAAQSQKKKNIVWIQIITE